MTDTPTPAPSGGTIEPPAIHESVMCLVCAREKPWGTWSPKGVAVCIDCRNAAREDPEDVENRIREKVAQELMGAEFWQAAGWLEDRRVNGEAAVTPPASAPGSGEVTAWGCEVDELVERIDRMTVEAGPGLDLRPHHQRMLIKEIWRLTEAVERARAEGEAKGRREERERCAKVICPGCAEGLAVEFDAKYPSIPMHRYPVAGMEGRTLTSACKARRLAALAEGGGGVTSRDEKVYTIADMDAYRDGLNSIHAEEVASLRAQLLAARAEALEWAYDNTGLDMSFSSRRHMGARNLTLRRRVPIRPMEGLTMPDRDAIRARAEAATPGPWRHEPKLTNIEAEQESAEGSIVAGDDWFICKMERFTTGPVNDAAFIAHAREDIPALLAALATAEERATKAEQEVEARFRMLCDADERLAAAWARADAAERRGEEMMPLVRLGLAALEACRDGCDWDGGEIQDKAVEYGVVVPTPIVGKQYCGEGCRCEEYGADVCYRDSEATVLARAASGGNATRTGDPRPDGSREP